MNFQDLHELLRLEVLRRIATGALTGTKLAQQTGFQQAHISNFLNRKRALSLEGLDRVLAAQDLKIDEILSVEVNASAEAPLWATPHPMRHASQSGWLDTQTDQPIVMVPIVSAMAAVEEAQIQPAGIIETLPLELSRLSDNRTRPAPRSAEWQRFVALRLDAQQAAAMEPLLASGTVAVIDRHYNSLAPYRAHQPTLYAIRYGAGLLLRYAEFEDSRIILRPTALDCAVQLLAVRPNEMPSDYIVGRVCLLIHEL